MKNKTGQIFKCEKCNKEFYKPLWHIKKSPNHHFCSKICSNNNIRRNPRERVKCLNCQTIFIRDNDKKNLYCSRECKTIDYTVDLTCKKCGKEFQRSKCYVEQHKKQNSKNTFCSLKCSTTYLNNILKRRVNCECEHCGKSIERVLSEFTNYKHHYCSNNCLIKSKITLPRGGRSKLEEWFEEKLRLLYPKLKFEFNNREILDGLELDIYIPELKIAIEINGIFHYEPIFGNKGLTNQKKRDTNKVIQCAKKEIDLCIIDTSSFKHFKEKKAQKFLNIIIKIINER